MATAPSNANAAASLLPTPPARQSLPPMPHGSDDESEEALRAKLVRLLVDRARSKRSQPQATLPDEQNESGVISEAHPAAQPMDGGVCSRPVDSQSRARDEGADIRQLPERQHHERADRRREVVKDPSVERSHDRDQAGDDPHLLGRRSRDRLVSSEPSYYPRPTAAVGEDRLYRRGSDMRRPYPPQYDDRAHYQSEDPARDYSLRDDRDRSGDHRFDDRRIDDRRIVDRRIDDRRIDDRRIDDRRIDDRRIDGRGLSYSTFDDRADCRRPEVDMRREFVPRYRDPARDSRARVVDVAPRVYDDKYVMNDNRPPREIPQQHSGPRPHQPYDFNDPYLSSKNRLPAASEPMWQQQGRMTDPTQWTPTLPSPSATQSPPPRITPAYPGYSSHQRSVVSDDRYNETGYEYPLSDNGRRSGVTYTNAPRADRLPHSTKGYPPQPIDDIPYGSISGSGASGRSDPAYFSRQTPVARHDEFAVRRGRSVEMETSAQPRTTRGYNDDYDYYPAMHDPDDERQVMEQSPNHYRSLSPTVAAHDRGQYTMPSPIEQYPPQRFHSSQQSQHHDSREYTYDTRRFALIDDDDDDDDNEAHRHAHLRISVASDSGERRLLPAAPPQSSPKQLRQVSPAASSKREYEPRTSNEYDDEDEGDDVRVSAHFYIPSNTVSGILERRGKFIQAISRQSQCKLSILKAHESRVEDEQLVRIDGKTKGIVLALQLLIDRIRESRVEKNDALYADIMQDLVVPVAEGDISEGTMAWLAANKNKAVQPSSSAHTSSFTSPLCWLVPCENVGKVMGPKGSILTSIRHETGTLIHVSTKEEMAPGSNERSIIIKGDPDSIEAAWKEIKRRAGGRFDPGGRNVKSGAYFAVPFAAVGFLIGVKGSRAKEIADTTGARLQILSQTAMPLGSLNRIVHVQGSAEQTDHTARVMHVMLLEYFSVTPSSLEGRRNFVSVRVVVSSRVVARLLKDHAQLLRDVKTKSGAYVTILNPQSDERLCLFSGEMADVLVALTLVLRVMAEDIGERSTERQLVKPRGPSGSQSLKRKREVDASYSDERNGPLDENHELPTKRPTAYRAVDSRKVQVVNDSART